MTDSPALTTKHRSALTYFYDLWANSPDRPDWGAAAFTERRGDLDTLVRDGLLVKVTHDNLRVTYSISESGAEALNRPYPPTADAIDQPAPAPVTFTDDDRRSLIAFYDATVREGKPFHAGGMIGASMSRLQSLFDRGFLIEDPAATAFAKDYAITEAGAQAISRPYPPQLFMTLDGNLLNIIGGDDEGFPIPPRTPDPAPADDDDETQELPAVNPSPSGEVVAPLSEFGEGSGEGSITPADEEYIDSAEADALHVIYDVQSGAPLDADQPLNISRNAILQLISERRYVDVFTTDGDDRINLLRVNQAGCAAIEKPYPPANETRLPVDTVDALVRSRTAAMEAELDAARRELEALRRVQRQQSDMLREAVTTTPRYEIEAKTLIQAGLSYVEQRAAADKDLAAHLNDGWTVINMTVFNEAGVSEHFFQRVVTLQRVKPADPVAPRDAFAEAVEELDIDPLPSADPLEGYPVAQLIRAHGVANVKAGLNAAIAQEAAAVRASTIAALTPTTRPIPLPAGS